MSDLERARVPIGNRGVDPAGDRALSDVRGNGADLLVGRNNDRRILAGALAVELHQVWHFSCEPVAIHVIDDQGDGAQLLAQSERTVCGKRDAAKLFPYTSEHRVGDRLAEPRFAAVRASVEYSEHRVRQWIARVNDRSLPQPRRQWRRIQP